MSTLEVNEGHNEADVTGRKRIRAQTIWYMLIRHIYNKWQIV